LIFRHESFQLWESEIAGFLTTKRNDFVTVNRDGINLLALGSKEEKRQIMDAGGNARIIHSLESANFLKVDPSNYLLFACAKMAKREVQVQQEFMKSGSGGDETSFESIYNVKIWQVTLRELLLFNSLYLSKTLAEIVDLVNDQPNPSVFYKSFLEFDGANLCSILSFDSRSMEYLLDGDKFAEHFSTEYPIFYKNKIQKGATKNNEFFYRNAIDNALKHNQVKAVSCIIKYITTYQNVFSSSYLFNRNFSILFEKGVDTVDLFKSEIFMYSFDYDDWPGTHDYEEMENRPYNGSIFDIRNAYRDVFYEDDFEPIDNDDEGPDSKKVDSK